VVKARRIYTISLLCFINFISQTDDIQDVRARTVGEKVDLLAPGGGGGAHPTVPTPLATGTYPNQSSFPEIATWSPMVASNTGGVYKFRDFLSYWLPSDRNRNQECHNVSSLRKTIPPCKRPLPLVSRMHSPV